MPLAGAPLQIGAWVRRQATGEGLYLRLLAPRHVHRHGPGALHRLGHELGERAQGLQLGSRRDPGSKQGAERPHVAIEACYLLKAQGLQALGEGRRLAGEGEPQVVIGLVLPPVFLVGEQAIQLSKTVGQHGEPVLWRKKGGSF